MTIEGDRIYLLGATGRIGSVILPELIKAGVQVTVYARSPAKVPKAENITIVQGDYDDLTPFENSIAGHTRLFLLVADREDLDKVKIAFGTRAYAAGIKQLVELSARRLPWRSYNVVHVHQQAEDALYAIKDRGYHVVLRPTNFMTNMTDYDTIKNDNRIVDSADSDEQQEWISPADIGTVAARILLQPVEQHKDVAYELIGDVKTPAQRAAIISKLTGRTISYSQLPVQELYDFFIKAGETPSMAYYMSTYQSLSPVSRGLPLLLGRAPEKLEDWAANNKDLF
ncbi:hypothetical protein BDB00DRAFT_391976 [Zychaea mexicana]|uniref:uncharacterized protein n=1 Tax=Zychaea mexicana TaxID=64656 RepID=UPI0022FE2B0A|nr:uncharacterized protein BDB00DRAFT_391976 [Zychaea mexicana]KAI9498590.1 hypothetical protein BDB00DRAFT_391976 [Zychaea mexicana]